MGNTFTARKGKNKVIKLNSEESIIEGNLVQLPFIAPYRGDTLTSIEYRWTTREDGQVVERCVEVSGHGKLGVPTLKDKRVLRALQDIYIWSKVKDGELNLEKDLDKINEEDLLIKFDSIDKVATVMGYSNLSGQQRKSIKESIDRLVGTTIYVKNNGGIYDPVTKRYITDKERTFRYIEEAESYSYYDCEKCDLKYDCSKGIGKCVRNNEEKKNYNQIKISKFFYASIANNYRLYYNRTNVNKIKNLIAENVFLISRKWIGDGCVSVANIQRYMDRIPMNSKADKHKKQAIKDAVAVLDQYDFVEAKVDNDIVTIKHLDRVETSSLKKKDKIATDSSFMKDRYVTFMSFKEGMMEIGFDESEFFQIIDVFIQKIEYLKALLRYVNVRAIYNKDNDRKNHYVTCLSKGTEIDKKYFN